MAIVNMLATYGNYGGLQGLGDGTAQDTTVTLNMPFATDIPTQDQINQAYGPGFVGPLPTPDIIAANPSAFGTNVGGTGGFVQVPVSASSTSAIPCGTGINPTPCPSTTSNTMLYIALATLGAIFFVPMLVGGRR